MKYIPILDHVILKKIEKNVAAPASGILLPKDNDTPDEYQVVAMGPGRVSEFTGRLMPLDYIKINDIVRVTTNAPAERFIEDGVSYLLVRSPEGIV